MPTVIGFHRRKRTNDHPGFLQGRCASLLKFHCLRVGRVTQTALNGLPAKLSGRKRRGRIWMNGQIHCSRRNIQEIKHECRAAGPRPRTHT